MKKEIGLDRKEKTSKGITLIALVITIIVLLILAAVSIATLTGENGILTKAKTAKEETEKATAIEKAKVAVMGSYDKNGHLNLEELRDNLKKVEGIQGDVTGADFPITVTIDGQEITVNKNGTVENKGSNPITFNPETLTIGTATNTDKYGWKVNGYNVTTDEFASGVWRLFFQDSNYTYLITDECVGSYKPSDYYGAYQSGADVSTVGQKLSPKISTLFTSSNENGNIRTMAWLTDTSDTGMWSSYKNTDAVFAIGSPTAELFATSYNNRSNKSNTLILSLDTLGYGYEENTNIGWFLVDENYGIYNKSTSSNWWIASPGWDNSTQELYINGENGYFDYKYYVNINSAAVRPIVCIPTSVFNSKYTLENK